MRKPSYQSIIAHAGFGYAFCRIIRDERGFPQDYEFLEVNKLFAGIVGLEAGTLNGKKLQALIRNSGFSKGREFREYFEWVIKTGQQASFNYYAEPANAWYHVQIHPEERDYLLVLLSEFSQRDMQRYVAAEDELKKREKDFSSLVEHANDMIVRFDSQLRHIYCNKAVEKHLGVPRRAFLGKTPVERNDSEESRFIYNTLKETLKEGKERTVQQQYPAKNGTKYFETHIVPERDENGTIESLLAITRDITERRRASEALRENERFLQSIFDTIQDGISILNPDLTIRYVNRVMKTWYASQMPLKGKHCYWAYHHREKPCNPCPSIRSMQSGKTEMDIVPGPPGSGFQYLELYSYPMKDAQTGKITGIIEFVRDITDRKRMEEALRQSNKRKALAADSAGIGIWELNLNTHKLHWDAWMFKLYGINAEAFTATREAWKNLLHPGDGEKLEEEIKAAQNGKSEFNMEFRVMHPDGIMHYLKVTAITLKDRQGSPETMIGVNFDITERRKSEKLIKKKNEELEAADEELRASYDELKDINQKLETQKNALEKALADYEKAELSLKQKNEELEAAEEELRASNDELKDINKRLEKQREELIEAKERAEESDRLKTAFLANMSHEIRTPLNGILGFTGLLLKKSFPAQKRQKYVSIIDRNGRRMLSTINDLIDISKIESGQMQAWFTPININQQMDELYAFFRVELEQKGLGFYIEKNLPDEKAVIQTDAEKLYAVLTNLVKNAAKYTEKGGIHVGYTPLQNELRFYVKDTGIGIAKKRQKAIFERFVQADLEYAQAKEGAGLGLAITKAYVEMLGGRIWVESQKNQGSMFFFTLPYRDAFEKQV